MSKHNFFPEDDEVYRIIMAEQERLEAEEHAYYEEMARLQAESASTEEEIAEMELFRAIQEREREENFTLDDLPF